jgi:hypothetical protein
MGQSDLEMRERLFNIATDRPDLRKLEAILELDAVSC